MTSDPAQHAILFDMDDTLLLTREVKWAHHRHTALEHYGITLADEALHRHWGEPFDQMIGNLYQHSDSVEAMRAANQSSAHLFPKQPVPGATEVVAELVRAGHPVGVVTSTNTSMALADLERCGFDVAGLVAVQGADKTPFHKPDPRVFDELLDRLAQLGVERVTYVGDALMDAQAAAGAGMGFVAITTGLFDEQRFRALWQEAGEQPSAVISDIRELPDLLRPTPTLI